VKFSLGHTPQQLQGDIRHMFCISVCCEAHQSRACKQNDPTRTEPVPPACSAQ
jgi:hypothetical protein